MPIALRIGDTAQLESRFCAVLQHENREKPEAARDKDEDEHINPPLVRLDVIGADEGLRHGLVLRIPTGRCLLAKFIQDVEVHSVFEGAKILGPSEPHGDLRRLDEEAGEEQLGHKDARSSLRSYLRVGSDTTDEEGCGGSGDAEDPKGKDLRWTPHLG